MWQVELILWNKFITVIFSIIFCLLAVNLRIFAFYWSCMTSTQMIRAAAIYNSLTVYWLWGSTEFPCFTLHQKEGVGLKLLDKASSALKLLYNSPAECFIKIKRSRVEKDLFLPQIFWNYTNTSTVKGHYYSPPNKKTSKLSYTQCFVLVCAIYGQKIYNWKLDMLIGHYLIMSHETVWWSHNHNDRVHYGISTWPSDTRILTAVLENYLQNNF